MTSLIPHKLNVSIPQLKRLLKGHAVQLSKELIGSGAGDKVVHLNKKNANKLMRAYNNSKGMRLTLGPDEMSITGGNVIATSKDVSKDLINAGGDRAVRAIEGSNVKKTAKKNASRLITAGTDRALRALAGSGVNRLNKANRWQSFVDATLRDTIDTAGKAGRVYYDTNSPLTRMGFGARRKRGGNVIATSKDVSKDLINAGGDRAVRAIEGSGRRRGGYGLYGYGAMQPAVMPVNAPKLGKGLATRTKVYRNAMRRNIGVDIDNASIAKPPSGRYNSAVKPTSSIMTMSPYQGTNSPAMHPFIPMNAYQNSGVSPNMR